MGITHSPNLESIIGFYIKITTGINGSRFEKGANRVSRLTEEIVRLTERERDVLREVAKGASAKEAAITLRIAPSTIERHIENARLKTRTRNRAHLIGFTVSHGLL